MESLQRFSRHTTIHGWYQVFVGAEKEDGGSRWLVWASRMFWSVVLAFCWGFLVYYCSINIAGHYRYPTVTTTSISTRHLPIPAVTVFNTNELRFSRFTPTDILHVGRYFLGINDNFTAILPEAKKYLNETQVEDILKKARNATALNGTDEANDFDSIEFVHRVGHQRQGMIAWCNWTDSGSEEITDCQEYGNISQGLVYLFGNSYTINRNQKMILKEASYHGGLHFSLNTEEEDYLPFIVRETFRERLRHGVFLVMHHPVVSFFHATQWFNLDQRKSNNYHVLVHSVRRIEHLSPPWGSCYDGPETDNYVAEDCIQNCLSRILTERFGCILYDMASWNYKKTCMNINNNYTLSHSMRYNGKYIEECKEECPISCTEWIYNVELIEGPHFTDNPKGRISVNVGCFNRLQYETIKEMPFQDSTELLAELGGMVGLFLGASVISLLDLVLFLLGEGKKLISKLICNEI